LPPLSLIPVAHLPPSLIPAAMLSPVSLIPVVHIDLRISLQIFVKIRNGPNGILWGWGELSEKTRSKKSRDTVPFAVLLYDEVCSNRFLFLSGQKSEKYLGRGIQPAHHHKRQKLEPFFLSSSAAGRMRTNNCCCWCALWLLPQLAS
jgi:hypothetical protein